MACLKESTFCVFVVFNYKLKTGSMNVLMYIGFAINIIGVILLLIFTGRYYSAVKIADKMDLRQTELRANISFRRKICLIVMMFGWLIALIGAAI